jgi:hypothetical protein
LNWCLNYCFSVFNLILVTLPSHCEFGKGFSLFEIVKFWFFYSRFKLSLLAARNYVWRKIFLFKFSGGSCEQATWNFVLSLGSMSYSFYHLLPAQEFPHIRGFEYNVIDKWFSLSEILFHPTWPTFFSIPGDWFHKFIVLLCLIKRDRIEKTTTEK